MPDDPSETRDLSAEYPEIQAYFNDVIQAIWRGGFDEDYHPGQNYDEDYRGWNSDNILRPYLSRAAQSSYEDRTLAVNHDTFDYDSFPPTWIVNPNKTVAWTWVGQNGWDPLGFRDSAAGSVDAADSHDGLSPPSDGFQG